MVELGEKHECEDCGVQVYDLGRSEVPCPRCGRDLMLERDDSKEVKGKGTTRAPAKARKAAAKKPAKAAAKKPAKAAAKKPAKAAAKKPAKAAAKKPAKAAAKKPA